MDNEVKRIAEGPSDLERDPLALAMFAAWVGVEPDKVPREYRAHTCKHTREAWRRVGEAAIKYLEQKQ